MRNLKLTAILAGIILVFMVPAFAEQSLVESVAIVSNHSGDARIYTDGQWKDAEINMPLFEGDYLRTTSGSSLEVTFDDATIVKLGDNTELKLTELKRKENAAITIFNLVKGRFMAIVDHLKNADSKFEVHTKMAIAAVKGTELAVEANEDGTNLGVYTGKVEFKTAAGDVKLQRAVFVDQGNESGIGGTGAPSQPSRIRIMSKFEAEFGGLREEINTVRELKSQGGDALYRWRIEKKRQIDGKTTGTSNTEGTIGGTNKYINKLKDNIQDRLKARLGKEFYNERSHAFKDLRFVNGEMNADVHLGKTMTDVHGNRVRIEEFLYRPNDKQYDLLSITLRDKGRLDYLRAENLFNNPIPSFRDPAWKSIWQKTWTGTAPTIYLTEQRIKMSNMSDWVFTGVTYQPTLWTNTGSNVAQWRLLKDQDILAFGSTEIAGVDMTVDNFTSNSLNYAFVREQRLYGYQAPLASVLESYNPATGDQGSIRGPLDKTFATQAEYDNSKTLVTASSSLNNTFTKLAAIYTAAPASTIATAYTVNTTAPQGLRKFAYQQTRFYNDGSDLTLNLYLIDDYGILEGLPKPDASLIEDIFWGINFIANTNVELSVNSSVFTDKGLGIDIVSKMLWWLMINPKNQATSTNASTVTY
jgi:hypothetical protein